MITGYSHGKLMHVTYAKHVQSIILNGVSPDFARTLYPSTWWIRPRLLRAMVDHLIKRDETNYNDIVVFERSLKSYVVIATRWKGVYRVNSTVWVSGFEYAEAALTRQDDKS